MTGGFPLDLILFAMVAAFLVLRLRSVLGRGTGFERPPAPEPRAPGYDPRAAATLDGVAEEGRPAPPNSGTRPTLPAPRTVRGQALGSIAAAERVSDPGNFLNGAEGAFRSIVTAFAA